jgi:hypothetical protein
MSGGNGAKRNSVRQRLRVLAKGCFLALQSHNFRQSSNSGVCGTLIGGSVDWHIAPQKKCASFVPFSVVNKLTVW